ncbi:hypothetical protein ABTY53_16575 [Streptomyces noursei]
MHAAVLCAAGVLVAAAVLALVLLRGVRTAPAAGHEAGGDHGAAAPVTVN